MSTALAPTRHLTLAGDSVPPLPDDDDAARLTVAVQEAYLLADELERLLPAIHRGKAHRLRLAAEVAGGLHVASQARRARSVGPGSV